jgi:hypothetical protein
MRESGPSIQSSCYMHHDSGSEESALAADDGYADPKACGRKGQKRPVDERKGPQPRAHESRIGHDVSGSTTWSTETRGIQNLLTRTWDRGSTHVCSATTRLAPHSYIAEGNNVTNELLFLRSEVQHRTGKRPGPLNANRIGVHPAPDRERTRLTAPVGPGIRLVDAVLVCLLCTGCVQFHD